MKKRGRKKKDVEKRLDKMQEMQELAEKKPLPSAKKVFDRKPYSITGGEK